MILVSLKKLMRRRWRIKRELLKKKEGNYGLDLGIGITVKEEHQYCDTDVDCVRIPTTCSPTCEYHKTAINKTFANEYKNSLSEMCMERETTTTCSHESTDETECFNNACRQKQIKWDHELWG